MGKNEGQQDLDLATEKKLNATSHSELGEVIDLCESALKKGRRGEHDVRPPTALVDKTATRRGRGGARLKLAGRDQDWLQFPHGPSPTSIDPSNWSPISPKP